MLPSQLTKKLIYQSVIILSTSMMLSACVGTVVGAAVDTAIEVIKIPFKVGGAVIDAVKPEELAESFAEDELLKDRERAAIDMESEGLE